MTATFTAAETQAMRRALQLAASPGVPTGPNPRVGCVLLDGGGATVAEGFHRGAGTAHAEADALARAGSGPGTTAVVTLEPCNHSGRTGPCAEALVAAGVARVVFAQADPNPVAAGGATLRGAGLDVAHGLLADEARAVNRVWTFAVEHGRPFVTWKFAATLDGRSAAADGTSRWVSSPAAREDAPAPGALRRDHGRHRDRAGRRPRAHRARRGRDPAPWQPLRAVMGLRPVPADRRVLNDAAETVVLPTRDPAEALAALYARDRQHVFLEGGPPWRRRSSRPGSSTRWSATSPRCSSAPG